jgi:hypothetical protein
MPDYRGLNPLLYLRFCTARIGVNSFRNFHGRGCGLSNEEALAVRGSRLVTHYSPRGDSSCGASPPNRHFVFREKLAQFVVG